MNLHIRTCLDTCVLENSKISYILERGSMYTRKEKIVDLGV